MFGTKKPSDNWSILRIQIQANLFELDSFVRSEGTIAEIEPELTTRFSSEGGYTYEINVMHNSDGTDWYWHTAAGKPSQALHAIVDLEAYRGRGLSPAADYETDLEIEVWNGYLSVSFGRKCAILVPLAQAASLQRYGHTLHNTDYPPLEEIIEFPCAFESDFKTVKATTKVAEHVGQVGAIYWNSMLQVRFDIPNTIVHSAVAPTPIDF